MPGHDGEQIPLNVYFKKGAVKLNRRNRVLMEGYGAYGLNMHQGFNIVNLSSAAKDFFMPLFDEDSDGNIVVNKEEMSLMNPKPSRFSATT